MDYQIIWSPSLIRDLNGIVQYIAEEDPDAAKRVGYRIIEAVEQASAFPRSGRIVPEFSMQDIRELVIVPYRIVYRIRIEVSTIEVARVWHARRGNPKL